MKVGYYGLRAKGLSFVTILLMCSTVFVWTWKRTPILSTFPAQGRFELARDIQRSVPVVGWGEDEVVVAALREHGKDETGEGENRMEKRENNVSGEDETDSEEARKEERKKEETITKEMKKEASRIEDGNDEGTREEDRMNEEATKEGKGNEETRRKREQNEEIGKEKTTSTGPEEKSSKISKVKECNYAKGKWVVDHNQTLYSGFGCKQWLSEMWSCRSTRRTDFTYENLRWQPKDCHLERFEESKFLKRLRKKTLAFVGDSLGRQQFQSLICMITSGNQRDDIIDVGEEYGIARSQGHARAHGWAFRFPSTNTTVLYYWSASLCDIQPMDTTNPNTNYAMHLDRPAAFLTQNIHRIDVLVLNTAHHWNRGKLKANRWVMHIGGALNTNRHLQEIWKARNLTVHSVIKWANAQLPKYPNLKVFYRTISPRHFVGGDWNTGGSCDNTTPMSIGKEIVQDESSDSFAASAVKGTGVKLLDVTALSSLRDEAHISRFRGPPNSKSSDCLHWCLPGVPDTWNEILFAQL